MKRQEHNKTLTLVLDIHMLDLHSWHGFRDSFFPAYLELVNTIVPGPQSNSYFIPQVLLITCLLVPSTTISHDVLARLAMPVIIASTVHAWIAMRGVDVISVDTLWWSFFFLVLKDPRRDFKRLVIVDAADDPADASDMSGVVEELYPVAIWPRLQWVFALISNRPLTSWKIGVASHDAKVCRPYVHRTRLSFIKGILQRLLPAVAITMPLALQLKAYDPFFSKAGQPLTLPYGSRSRPVPFTIDILQRTIPRIVLRPLIVGMYLYSLMILMFLPPYLLPVLASFPLASFSVRWSPHSSPRPHFGKFSAILDSGLRGLWGRWWHQQMRHAVSEPGRWLTTKLQLKRGGLTRYSCICVSAFLLSGFTHTGLVPPEPRSAKVYGPWELRFMVAGFFWMQPLGILLEVILVEKMIGSLTGAIAWSIRSRLVLQRSLRLLWVLVFMSCSMVFLINPFLELGFWELWPPFFLEADVQWILRGEWVP